MSGLDRGHRSPDARAEGLAHSLSFPADIGDPESRRPFIGPIGRRIGDIRPATLWLATPHLSEPLDTHRGLRR
jgi:hypothetical protein